MQINTNYDNLEQSYLFSNVQGFLYTSPNGR